MRKIAACLISCLLPFVSSAQTDVNFQLLSGIDCGPGFRKEQNVFSVKPTLEATSCGKHHLAYGYIQFAQPLDGNQDNNAGYAQMFWEQNFWTAPLMLHGEFRTYLWGGDYHNVWYAGLGYTFGAGGSGYIELEALYRYQQDMDGSSVTTRHGFQLSVVDGFELGRISVSNYEDFWVDNRLRCYSETRVFYRLASGFHVGAYICINYNDQWSMTGNKTGTSLLAALKIVL